MRRRVKEQLKKLGGMEFYDVNFSYIDLDDMSEHYISVPEQGGGKLIQDFRARTPEKGIAAMDGGAIPVRPALKNLRRMSGTSCVPEPEHRDGPAA